MKLRPEDLKILATRHGNSYEATTLRNRLLAVGRLFCSLCKHVKACEDFPKSKRGRGGRGSACIRCKGLSKKTKLKTGYVAHGLRSAENSARFRRTSPEAVKRNQGKYYARHGDKIRKRSREYARTHPSVYDPITSREGYLRNRDAILERAAKRRVENPGVSNAAKRRTFLKRKALGMSGRQANFMSPAPEFADQWNVIKGASAQSE